MPAVTVFSSARPWSCTSSQAVRAEHPGEVLGARLRGFVVPLSEVQGDLAREAGREPDQAARVPLEHLPVDARPAVKPLEESDGRELDEMLVAGAAPREQHEMRIRPRRFGRGALALVPVAEREVCLEAEDGPDLARSGLGV